MFILLCNLIQNTIHHNEGELEWKAEWKRKEDSNPHLQLFIHSPPSAAQVVNALRSALVLALAK